LRSRLRRLEGYHSGGRCALCRDEPDTVILFPEDPEPEPCPGCGFLPEVQHLIELVVDLAANHPGLPTAAEVLPPEVDDDWRAQGLHPERLVILEERGRREPA
jgi:hypothetical protein